MLELTSALYRRAGHWAGLSAEGAGPVSQKLGALLADQLAQASEGIDRSKIRRNFVVSTMLDLPFTSGWLKWPEIAQAARAASPEDLPDFDNFVSSYECASWGYCLRYAAQELEPGEMVAISVLDINILNLSYWEGNSNWGKSGFGLATIVLTLDEETGITCNIAKSINAFGEFCLDMRSRAQTETDSLLVPPFFPHDIASMYTKLVPEERRTQNLTDTWGHCFGSDPWVGLIEEVRAGGDWAGQTYTATSVALNGYWVLARLRLNPAGRFEILPDLPAIETDLEEAA